jgi:hypothetical protein
MPFDDVRYDIVGVGSLANLHIRTKTGLLCIILELESWVKHQNLILC